MSQRTAAYLTMRDPGDYVTDHDLSFEALAALDWQAEPVVWSDPAVDWGRFDAVYLCSAWDYPQHVEQFLALLERIDKSRTVLVNDLSLVHWNLRKTYLRDLQERGADIVPSLWLAGIGDAAPVDAFAALQTDTLVIKPVVGANAQDTFVLRQPLDDATQALLRATFANRECLLQPFVEAVCSEGEFSLFFFAGTFSHAILKTPADGDFRSQEEHGSEIRAVNPEAGLLQAASHIVELVEPQPVYARVDLVRGTGDRFLLMELELIEPSLYFRTDVAAPARFAAAFDNYVREQLR